MILKIQRLLMQQFPIILELSKPLSKLKIGLPSCFFQPQVDQKYSKQFLQQLKFLKLGGRNYSFNLQLPTIMGSLLLCGCSCAEASSNLSRYDGLVLDIAA